MAITKIKKEIRHQKPTHGDKYIPITCEGASTESIESFQNFQGNLKRLNQEQFQKIKASIIKHGMTFPIFVWRNEGKNQIIDGHQRLFTIKEMIKDGYSIDGIPVAYIHAGSKQEAAEKLLAVSSHYAKITMEGLAEFVNAYDLHIENMPELELPDVQFDLEPEKLKNEEEETAAIGEICPSCGQLIRNNSHG